MQAAARVAPSGNVPTLPPPAPEWFDWNAPDYERIWTDRAERIQALRAEPGKWAPLKEFYADDPVRFICDWGCTFDPRNTGTERPTTMPFLLFPRQVEFVAWLRERWLRREDGIVEKSRDMGISWCCVGFAVWLILFHPGSVAGFGSHKEDLVDRIGDPQSLFWKIRTFIDLLPIELRPRGFDAKKDAPFMRVLNREMESAIIGESGDNIGRGGRATIYFKDESAHYEHPEAIDVALSQTSNCQIDVSTPNGEGNPFWRKAHGGKIAKFVFDWRDDPRKGEAWYQDQVERLTPTALAAEVDRDYSASITNSFVDSMRVSAAMRRGPADIMPSGPLIVSLDVARFGDDSNVLTFRRGRVLLKQVEWNKSDLVSTAGRARQEILAFKTRPEVIAVDTIGVGAGVADILRTFPGWAELVMDVNSSLRMSDGKNYNLRSFMWQQMKDWLAGASIPNDPELRASLTALRYFYKAGEMLIESKDDAKKRGIKSPDKADSLAMSFALLTRKPKPADIPESQIVSHRTDRETGM